MPPMRKVLLSGASCAATCDGVKKNTSCSCSAVSTSAAPMPTTVTPHAMAMIRLFLGFTLYQTVNFREQKDERHAIRAPDVPGIAAHGEKFAHAAPRSRMMPRTRSIDAAMLYIQK